MIKRTLQSKGCYTEAWLFNGDQAEAYLVLASKTSNFQLAPKTSSLFGKKIEDGIKSKGVRVPVVQSMARARHNSSIEPGCVREILLGGMKQRREVFVNACGRIAVTSAKGEVTLCQSSASNFSEYQGRTHPR